MNAGRHNFIIEKGSTFSRVLIWKDENSSLINLTSYTARMHIRENIDDETTVIELTTENGRITLGGAAGTITLSITATDTTAIAVNRGVYDLELITGATVTRLIEGDVVFSPEATRES